MINLGRKPVLGVLISAVDYEFAVQEVLEHAKARQPFTVSALAVHGVMMGYRNDYQKRINGLNMVVPDGQPVRWALQLLHNIRLPDRVYGPELTRRVLQTCATAAVSVYFYGSSQETLNKLTEQCMRQWPELQIAGAEASRFKRLTKQEQNEVVDRIHQSGARVVFVGLGCPRQEAWVYEYGDRIRLPLLAVGAAFDFLACVKPQAPMWMQRRGLEWLFRLVHEPRRLWHRYLLLNPLYLFRIIMEWTRMRPIPVLLPSGHETEESFG